MRNMYLSVNSGLRKKRIFLALPDVAYPVFKEIEVKANKYNEIKLDGERIHVPRARNHSIIYGLLRFDSINWLARMVKLSLKAPGPT